jgi:Cupin
MNDPWQPVDPLGEALHFLRMSGTFYCRSEFTAPWGLTLPAMKSCLMFHVVTAGNCWVVLDGSEPTQLLAGSLALVPHGEGHRLVSTPGAAAPGLFELPRELVSERYEILRHGRGDEATTVICSTARFDHPAALRLVQLLPALINVDARNTPETDWIQSTLRFVSSEAQAMRPGGETSSHGSRMYSLFRRFGPGLHATPWPDPAGSVRYATATSDVPSR